ncbi:MAG: vanadium-dependent haloperoxidase [Actinomycetota bacterium]|nr:vanadium-dependent haloperoxidase [Actinomycetota bacterium]
MKALAASLLLALAAVLGACTADGSQRAAYLREDCERRDLDGRSVARLWNEALLHAIQRDTPAPTVHARNLFHVSAAMWDAWAAYDPDADGWLVREKVAADDVGAAREAALSYAAYRLLLHRYAYASGLQETFDELVATLESLCFRIDYVEADGDSPAALGNRIGAAYIAHGRKDGANEALRYADPAYTPANPPLVVSEPGTEMRDPNRWQPLALARIVAQNGTPIPGSVQSSVGPHWGKVAAFALPRSAEGVPIDPGKPPGLDGETGGRDFKRSALAVIRASAQLDPSDGVELDIGPGARGTSSLGTNDGRGHEVNPATGERYAPNVVRRGDWARAIAEYWADGPRSETPPGHWNALANEVSDVPAFRHRIGGRGREVDRLEWDVKLYLALNGAVHDAAVAAWGLKGHYDSARPISMIRYLGGKGQSSDPRLPAYDPNGLPLEPGLVEVVTRRSSKPGGRHAALAGYVGEVAIRAWAGFPDDPATQASGVRWIRAVEWVPYQLPTFVTPAFAGYVSGHSTFSRAAAELLTAFTGSSYFPNGMYEVPVPRGSLKIEAGPSRDVPLQWATYSDAADTAGISRIYMGIHIPPDDVDGRRVGARCGKAAWELAQRHFAGTA